MNFKIPPVSGALHAVRALIREMYQAWLVAMLLPLQARTPIAYVRVRRFAKRRFGDRSSIAGTMLAIAAAALIAGGITVFTGAGDAVEASAPITSEMAGPIGPQCSQQPWPYYETYCVRDLRPLGANTRPPRVVTIERR
jgi:hypothetical protein